MWRNGDVGWSCQTLLMTHRSTSDEHYVLDLCDEVLGSRGQRQATFDWLRGDPSPARPDGTKLPVDGYWPELGLVVEFHEEQHSQPSPFFDRRHTVSGIGRGEQRRLYDERRRELVPRHGLRLVVIGRPAFVVRSGRIVRDRERDLEIVKGRLREEGAEHQSSRPNSTLAASETSTVDPVSNSAWVVRSGRYGERDEWAIENGFSGGGWREVPDLSAAHSRDEVDAIVAETYPSLAPGARTNVTAQLWALRGRIAPGDLLVMPMKTTREIALGRVTAGYRFLEDQDPGSRHVVTVDWQRQVPRSAIKQDLLYTLGSALTIFSPSRNNAFARLENVLATGEDVGSASLPTTPAPAAPTRPGAAEADVVDEPESQPDIELIAHDQISSKIAEEFSGHGLAHLVAALLEVEGFDVDEAPPGADGGIDITAGRGLLGLESPKLIVQVKTGQVASEVVAQLNGLVHTHGADYGLLATWAGLSKPARDAVKHQRFRVKVWDSTDIVGAVLRNYERLPEDITERLPLRRVWMLKD